MISSVLRGSQQVIDKVFVKNGSGQPYTGLGKLATPAAPTSATGQSSVSGATINWTTFSSGVDIVITLTTTPGANGAANGETLASPIITSTVGTGTQGAVVIILPSFAGASYGNVNVYAGQHGGTLFLCTSSNGSFPVAFGTGEVQLNSVPTTGSSASPGTNPGGSNTSWPNGWTVDMIHDNDSTLTALNTYVMTLGTWINTSPPSFGWAELGSGYYQCSYPNVAFNQVGSKSVGFSIGGVNNGQGMPAISWDIEVSGTNHQDPAFNLVSTAVTSPVTADTWYPQGNYNNTRYFQGQATGLYLWSNGSGYTISAVLGTNGASYFTTTGSPVGTWTNQGSATGTPNPAAHDATQVALTQLEGLIQANVTQVNGNAQAAIALAASALGITIGVVSNDSAPTTTSWTANRSVSTALSSTTGFYGTPQQRVVFFSGTTLGTASSAQGKTVRIASGTGGYAVSANVCTFNVQSGDTLLAAPTVGDQFFIIAETP